MPIPFRKSWMKLTSTYSGRAHYGDPNLPEEVPQGWIPSKGIEVKNGTGDIFFKPVMPNSMLFINPVDDPLYASHTKVTSSRRGQNETRYGADSPIRLVTCVQQVSPNLVDVKYT
jgi:hypothetical protein